MLARLCWKEFRMFWPLWFLVGVCALGFQWLLLDNARADAQNGMLTPIALGWAALYACAVGAAAFAGERENGTLAWLDTMPVSRGAVWNGKFAYCLVTTLALSLLLVGFAGLGTAKRDQDLFPIGLVMASLGVIVIEALAWSLFWSSLLSNALIAAVAGVLSLGLVAGLTTGDVGIIHLDSPERSPLDVLAARFPWRLGMALIVLVVSRMWMTRPPKRTRIQERDSQGSAMGQHLSLYRPSDEVRAYGARIWKFANVAVIDFTPITRTFRMLRSLAWMSLRESRGVGLFVLVLGGLAYSPIPRNLGAWAGFGVLAAMLAGLNAFMHENRQRAFGFYVHHGVRPLAVWITKTLVSFFGFIFLGYVLVCVSTALMTGAIFPAVEILLGPIYFVAWLIFAPMGATPPMNMSLPSAQNTVGIMAVLLDAFAMGLFSGLVVRRGITAGVVALLGFVGFFLPQVLLFYANMIPSWSLFVSPALLLLASLAWTSNWLFDRTEAKRWIKLGFLMLVAVGGPLSWFVGYRAYGVPEVGLSYDPSWARSPSLPPEQNAAEFYRKAVIVLNQHNKDATSFLESRFLGILQEGSERRLPEDESFLRDNQPTIALIREGAAKDRSVFNRIETLDYDSRLDSTIQDMNTLAQVMALDARKHELDGDLKGAWDDVATMFRMANHVADPPTALLQRMIATKVHSTAIVRATAWAMDQRQTPALLRAALADLKTLLPLHSPTNAFKGEEVIANQTLAMPTADLSPHIIKSVGEFLPARAVTVGAVLAPWERQRTRRVLEMTTSRAIREVRESQRALGLLEDAGSSADQPVRSFTPEEYKFAFESTPLAKILLSPIDSSLMRFKLEWERNHSLQLIFALRIWQFEHEGEFPDSLDRLVPDVLDKLPLDPFSGKRFGYVRAAGQALVPIVSTHPSNVNLSSQLYWDRTKPGQWLLYSVGPDGQDDQGQWNTTQRPDDEMRVNYRPDRGGAGDIVHPLPATKTPEPPAEPEKR
ncbi:ABC transporter permease [Singulisphaera sp. PoT]|uniref:ABC transporter permease n=1 Tax=Singulisphaera sp. PoT TaxID=3411797 RepID=UPI003BF57DBB